MEKIYPFSDDDMVFDEAVCRYRVTENALLHDGINLRARLTRSGVDATAAIATVCRVASDLVYIYIHQYNTRNERQDWMIATHPAIRERFKNILLAEVRFIVTNGDLTRDGKTIDEAVSNAAKAELMQEIPGLGACLLYAGV